MLLQITDAIHYAHTRGVVHRDLKPSNILLDMSHEGPMPLVIDFGLAKNLHRPDSFVITRNEVLVGTPAYLSPELAEGEQSAVGVPSDVYQLGGILYQILTGVPPHRGSSLPAILRKVLLAPLPRPSELAPDVRPELEEICLRAMRRSPADRYPDAATFHDALAEAIEKLESQVVWS